jgi:adenosine deaminase
VAVLEAFGLTCETLCTLARNGFQASFLDEADKAAFVARVDAYETVALA